MCMRITFDYDYKLEFSTLKYSKRFVRIEKKNTETYDLIPCQSE